MSKPKTEAAQDAPAETPQEPGTHPAFDPPAFEAPPPAVRHYPDLAGVATQNLVDQIQGQGNFKASYINWARTMQLLRLHAPGWLPEMMLAPDGGVLHLSPVGGFLLIRFVHADGRTTPAVPQAVMDHKNNSVPLEKITSRDITDTHRRGVCLAASFTFGLAYELWAKIDLESGYGEQEQKPEQQPTGKLPSATHLALIKGSANVDLLRRNFALAWKQYEGDDTTQGLFKSQYDDRLNELAEEGGCE